MIYVLQLFGEIFVATQGGPGHGDDDGSLLRLPDHLAGERRRHVVGAGRARRRLRSIIAALLLRLLDAHLQAGATRMSATAQRPDRTTAQRRRPRARAGATPADGAAPTLIAFVFFFPMLWTLLTGFKTEADAAAHAADLPLPRSRSTTSAAAARQRTTSTLLRELGHPQRRRRRCSRSCSGSRRPTASRFTRPSARRRCSRGCSRPRCCRLVGALVPLIVIYKRVGLFDTRLGMILLYAAINLPLVIWMMRSFFADLPREIIEAAVVDGAGFFRIMTRDRAPADRARAGRDGAAVR